MINAQRLLDVLSEKGLTLGSVESFTGGLFAEEFTQLEGASKVFKGGLVTYSKESKVDLLGIPEEYINENGAVSWEVCQQMALKGAKVLKTDVTVAFTGNAGPGKEEGKAGVGETYSAIVYNGQIWPIPLNLEKERNEMREFVVNAVADAILSIVNE